MPQESSQSNSNEFIMAELSPDEEHILQLLEDMNKDTIWVNRTQKGIVPGTLETIKMYYTDTEAVHILESLVRNGMISRIDNGILLLCPSCGSHEASILKNCPSCESSKLRKRNKIVHTPCEHWGTFDEFMGGNTITCPVCKESIESDKILENEAGFSYSDPYYECQECGFQSNKVPSLYLCTKCKTKYQSTNAVQLEQTGYQILVDPLSQPEKPISPRKPVSEKNSTREMIAQLRDMAQQIPKDDPPDQEEKDPINPVTEEEIQDTSEENSTQEIDISEEPDTIQEDQLGVPETGPEIIELDDPDEQTIKVEEKTLVAKIVDPKIETTEIVNKVLLVAEEQMSYNLIIESLEKSGVTLEVTLIEDGAQVMKALRETYDLIIFDSELSTIDPSKVLDEIIKWKIKTPMILLDNGYLRGVPIGLNLVATIKRKQKDIVQISDLVSELF